MPRIVTDTVELTESVGLLNEVTEESAGAMTTAELNVVGIPPPLPGVMVRLRAPMVALLATENSMVSAVDDTTVVEWIVTPDPEMETPVPVL